MRMPEWQIDAQEYLRRLGLENNAFAQHLFLPKIDAVAKVLPLRDIAAIQAVVPMHTALLEYLMRRIKTLDGRLPFENASFEMMKMHPQHMKIGQKFVYRENYQMLFEKSLNIFHPFLVTAGGLGDLGAYFVFGQDQDGNNSLACYIPPIVERHGADWIVMDGIHRMYITKQAGGLTINAILIENVSLPFPCWPRKWSEVEIISLADKPKDMNERYFDLKQELFRDLKYLGIDG